MTRPPRPEVSDPELRAALDSVGDHIENYNPNLDAISKDIKSIEQYLTASGIRLSVTVVVEDTGHVIDEEYDGLNYAGGIHRDVEQVEWSSSDDAGDRWRVMYARFRWVGDTDICDGAVIAGPTYRGPAEVLDRKPLIETSIAVRLKAHKRLPELIRSVAKLVEVRPIQTSLTDDDIPF